MIYLIRSFGKDEKSAIKLGYAKDVKIRFSQYFYILTHNYTDFFVFQF